MQTNAATKHERMNVVSRDYHIHELHKCEDERQASIVWSKLYQRKSQYRLTGCRSLLLWLLLLRSIQQLHNKSVTDC